MTLPVVVMFVLPLVGGTTFVLPLVGGTTFVNHQKCLPLWQRIASGNKRKQFMSLHTISYFIVNVEVSESGVWTTRNLGMTFSKMKKVFPRQR